jgi:hypothetical protein
MGKKKTVAAASDFPSVVRPSGPVASGMQLPVGTVMAPMVPPFPPDLQERMISARKSGRYLVFVCEADEQGSINVFANRSAGYSPDLILRAYHEIGKIVQRPELAGVKPETKAVPAGSK